jgi:hypothetical protein
MMRLGWLAFTFALTAWPQGGVDPGRDALEWAVALRGRIREMHNPVVVAYGTGRLAAVVCAKDPVPGAGIFRDAIAFTDGIASDAFLQKGTTVLPVASFSGLWKFVMPAALKCDATLYQPSIAARAKARMDEERRKANDTLHRAAGFLDSSQVVDKQLQLDRAGQLVQAALEAGDPETLDMELLTQVLCLLHERAPDLSDDLFVRAVDFVMSAEPPNPGNLQELGKYLFTAPRYTSTPDEEEQHESFTVGQAVVENLMGTRDSANSDCIQAYIEALAQLSSKPESVARNVVVTYATAYQMMSRVQDLLPDRMEQMLRMLDRLEEAAGASAQQVQAKVGAAENPDPAGGSPAARNYWYVGRIQGLLAAGRFADARAMQTRMDDAPAAAQVGTLIDFAEAAAAIQKDPEWAMTLANRQRAGVKRSLLYAGIMAASKSPGSAVQVLQLAMRDVALLPAEQRIRLYAAVGGAVLRSDGDAGLNVMSDLVTAYNDQRVSPRKGVFDPRSVRRIYNPKADSATDSALVLPSSRGFYEAVETERGRHNFTLRVPGVDSFNMAQFLQHADRVEWARVAAVLTGLRDENMQVNSLVDLAGVRLSQNRNR